MFENSNVIVIVAIVAALYFFMKYTNCSEKCKEGFDWPSWCTSISGCQGRANRGECVTNAQDTNKYCCHQCTKKYYDACPRDEAQYNKCINWYKNTPDQSYQVHAGFNLSQCYGKTNPPYECQNFCHKEAKNKISVCKRQ